MSKYPPEFREQILELYRKGDRTFSDLGREFGLSPTTVHHWVTEDAKATTGGSGSSPDDKAELARLRRELKKKDEELDILGKALAFFVRKRDQ